MAKKNLKVSVISLLIAFVITGINIAIFVIFGFPDIFNSTPTTSNTPSSENIANDLSTNIDIPTSSTQDDLPVDESDTEIAIQYDINDGLILLSLADGFYKHLFVYHPESIPLTRITNSEGDDIDPEFSPDGSQIAYASNKNGQWDIYILEIKTGNETRLTDTPEYDGAPTWSPDGQWIAFESYINYNLEIVLLSTIDLNESPVQLTNNQAADHSPKWSPAARKIAFVSDRSGDNEILLADLDKVDDRFINISNNSATQDLFPAWSPDSQHLAWSSEYEKNRSIFYININSESLNPQRIGTGNRPIWDPSGNAVLCEINYPNSNALTIYSAKNGEVILPLTYLQSKIFGFDWKSKEESGAAIEYLVNSKKPYEGPVLWKNKNSETNKSSVGRSKLVQLPDISAPYPFLHDNVYESFLNLRTFTAEKIGWDFLQSLENAYIPITEPPEPGSENDWLLTGRAFAFNPLPLDAGWIKLIKEDIFGETYWRVYLKTRFQDGSQGQPLREAAWDISARYQGDTISFEQGGAYEPVASGYWVDFTEIALRYGWQRLPAQNNWRSYFPATRFNQFVITENVNWYDALLDIYPEEIINSKE